MTCQETVVLIQAPQGGLHFSVQANDWDDIQASQGHGISSQLMCMEFLRIQQ